MRNRILFYALKYHGNYQKIKNAIHGNESYSLCSYIEKFVTIVDPEYPNELKDLQYPPFILFYRGNINLLNDRMISIVGTRNITETGIKYCNELINKLNSQYVTVSGLAKGVDAFVHMLSLKNRKTIGVIGCGLDIRYPKCNAHLYSKMEEEHLIITEFPNGMKPLAANFPWRNRIIAALGNKLIVVEAKIKSGTMITVNEALELSKDVICFPYTVYSETGRGCNYLIKEGADLICDFDEIKEI